MILFLVYSGMRYCQGAEARIDLGRGTWTAFGEASGQSAGRERTYEKDPPEMRGQLMLFLSLPESRSLSGRTILSLLLGRLDSRILIVGGGDDIFRGKPDHGQFQLFIRFVHTFPPLHPVCSEYRG